MLLQALQEAKDVSASGTADDDLTVSSVHTRIQLISFCKARLAQFIFGSEPAFREQVRQVLVDIKTRVDALRALALRKLAAGEVDKSNELLLPSQRDNICVKLDASGLEGDFREDVLRLYETLDRLHIIMKVELDKDKRFYEVLGRMTAIECRPGYWDTPVVSELEFILAEEWTWRAQQEAVGVA